MILPRTWLSPESAGAIPEESIPDDIFLGAQQVEDKAFYGLDTTVI